MKNIFLPVALVLLLTSCQKRAEWTKSSSVDLGEITPIGLTYSNGNIWIADGDNNRLVELSKDGQVKNTFDGFERPMHLASAENAIYIPEYGSDHIIKFVNGEKTIMPMQDSLDAPAGVDVRGKEIAIADFYNHRILYFDGNTWAAFGKKGKAAGEFHYPTDIQLTDDKIYIADAYNNRVQVLDKTGKSLQVIGEAEGMNAATGIYVSEQEIFVTDFENDRVLIYDFVGKLTQTIAEDLSKPTDILMIGADLYIANYKGKNLVVYRK